MTRTQFRHWAALAAALAISIAALNHTWERHDLPPFDHLKAIALSHEKRAEYERMLFNELAFGWDTETARFMGDDATSRREAAWLAAANDGYELAHLVLQVARPSKRQKYHTEKPLRRLEELISHGDPGAMCMWLPLSRLVAHSRDEFLRKYRPTGMDYARKGLRRNHPRCMYEVGRVMVNDSRQLAHDINEGLQWLVRSERAGYGGSVAISHYLSQQPASVSNIERLLCWKELSLRYVAATSPAEATRLRDLAAQRKPTTVHACTELGL